MLEITPSQHIRMFLKTTHPVSTSTKLLYTHQTNRILPLPFQYRPERLPSPLTLDQDPRKGHSLPGFEGKLNYSNLHSDGEVGSSHKEEETHRRCKEGGVGVGGPQARAGHDGVRAALREQSWKPKQNRAGEQAAAGKPGLGKICRPAWMPAGTTAPAESQGWEWGVLARALGHSFRVHGSVPQSSE